MATPFIAKDPTLEDYWRSIILFGRNVASYKFALAKSLLELKPESGQVITLDNLAEPFARHVSDHLKISDKQATSASSTNRLTAQVSSNMSRSGWSAFPTLV